MEILKKQNPALYKTVVLFLFIAFSHQLFAGKITRNGKLTGTNIFLNNVLDIEEDLHSWTKSPLNPPSTWNFNDKQTDNRIYLRYSSANKVQYSAPWNIDVNVKIERFDKLGTALPVLNTVLSINYNPANPYTDIATYTTTAGHRVKVTITGITLSPSLGGVMPGDVLLENEIEIERYYNLPSIPVATIAHLPLVAGNNFTDIYWDFIQGAEEYDMEYVLVSSYLNPQPASVSNVDFSNATRISTQNNWHKLNLAFDNGKIYYRVRAIGIGGANLDLRLESDWLYSNTPIVIGTNFHTKSNWTYSSTFAEQGKTKEIVSFFDGSQRNRQTVSLSNTDNVTLVSESFYDYEGRPAIQTLPAPNNTFDNDLLFYQGFSLNNKLTPTLYTKNDFDDGNCNVFNYAMSSSSGSSNYYSNSNNYLGTVTNPRMFYPAIPDAFLYPMTRTTYNNENEKLSLSGVGVDHKIGSGHETIFLNATASQEKLDRLFGNEVGHAEHYKEEVVIDPNGQISVSFKNLSGQVIATAMRGEEPTNLLSLKDPSSANDEPYMLPENTKEDLTVFNQFNAVNNEYVVSKDFLVTNAGPAFSPTPYNFTYEMTPQTFNDLCTGNPFPCKYILKITITSLCTGALNANAPMNTYLNVEHNIDPLLYPTGYSVSFTMNFPANGIYKIEKSLKLDPAAITAYLASYQSLITNTATPSCIKPLSTLENEYEANMDQEECGSCQDYCVLQANSTYTATIGLPLDQNTPAWQNLYDQCFLQNCNAESVQKSCDGLLKKLKADVSPGGQYFEHMFPANTSYNILPTAAVLTTGPNPVGFIDLLFAMNLGNPSLGFNAFEMNFLSFLSANPSCPPIAPGNFTQSYLAANWSPCYADFLVQFHPEYCRYDRCQKLAASDSYDYLLQTLNYTTAQNTDANGVVCLSLPTCAVFNLSAPGAPGSSLISNDPFFTTPVGAGFAASMANEITNCPTCVALVGAAPVVLGTCSIPTPGTMWDYANCLPTPLSPLSPNYLNQKWRNFIVLYEYIKKKYQSSVPCPALVDGSFPPDLITSGYVLGTNSGVQGNFSPPGPLVAYPIDDGLSIRDPDFNMTLNAFLTAFPPLASTTTPPPPGFGSQYGPNDCWYDASYIDLGSDYSGNAQCPVFMTLTQNPGGLSFPGPANSGLQIRYVVSNVPGFVGNINLSNIINLPNSPQPVLTYLNIIANDINTYVSSPDFTASVDLSNPLLPRLLIMAPVSLGPTTLTGPPIQLSIQRTELSLGSDVCQYFNFNPSVKHCSQYVGPDCVCGEIQQLIDTYNAIPSPTLTLQQYIANQLNIAAYGSVTGPITVANVTAWMTNCATGSPVSPTLNGAVDPNNVALNTLQQNFPCNPPCNEQAQSEADYAAQQAYEASITSAIQNFIKNYTSICLNNLKEKFIVDYPEKEYHYTLYYYDQAGNLVRTVPPVAVKRIPASVLYTGTGGLNIINELRTLNTYSIYPGHTRVGQISGSPAAVLSPNSFVTNYHYNSYNQLTNQETTDGGFTSFWYDDLGRLRFSQNDKQKAAPCYVCALPAFYFGRYSYTMYDAQSRIIEVGENDETYFTITGTPPTINIQPFYAVPNIQTFPSQNGLQVTKTYYDVPIPANPVAAVFNSGQQEELRKRVATTSYEEVEDASDNTYDHATHYSYDVHGNVNQLVQDNQLLSQINEQYKKMEYTYDLISGKVNSVHYQNGLPDQYHHHYYYDADNRVTSAYTSNDNVHWERSARYFYYLHGPLARVEYGDEKVQGSDYAYTIQGWIKGVNGSVIDEQKDLGLDANLNTSLQYMNTQQNIHSNFAKDVFGYSLDYYAADYSPVGGPSVKSNLTANLGSSAAFVSTPDLFNGNIRGLTHAITDPVLNTPMLGLSRWFRYDQLNRIKEANNYLQASASNDLGSSLLATTDYYEKFRYDANGNILAAKRNGYTGGSFNNSMDDMSYNYVTGSNKLDNVKDAGDNTNPASAFNDIKNQISTNYNYDAIGNLITDVQEQILNIEWNVYGKIKNIYRQKTSLKPDMEFMYDASGNRVCKIKKPRISIGGGLTGVTTQEFWTYTYYVRDAQGNVMAVYDRDVNYISSILTEQFTLKESHLYGSNRLAIDNRNIITSFYQFTFLNYNADGTISKKAPVSLLPSVIYNADYRTLGNKFFEFSNHLGNVLNTITDRKISIDANADLIIDYYKPDTKTATDYYAFGAPIPNRQVSSLDYRYGFNGKENDNEVKTDASGMPIVGSQQDYGMRIYDPRLGKFLSVDPLIKEYPWYSPYLFAGNKPIWAMDLNGAEEYFHDLKKRQEDGNIALEALHASTINDRTFILKFFIANGINGELHSFEYKFKYSQMGIKEHFVPYKGKWVHVPDIHNLPDEGDDAWDSFETYEEYEANKEANVDEINSTMEVVGMLQGLKLKLGNLKISNNINNKLSDGKGWKLGQKITRLTSVGKTPSWSTIRSRYWKNKAFYAKAGQYSEENIARMKKGRAPKMFDPGTGKVESIELHHPKGREGKNIFEFEEVLPSEHAAKDPNRRLGN